MLSCKEIVKTVSSEERPRWRRRLEVRLHLMMCHHCRKYAKQLDIMKAGFKNLFSIQSDKVDQTKIESIENEVLRKLPK